MLYYSGLTRVLGSVDDGSTVTDFLPAERERGITIQSAAITFYWPPLEFSSSSAQASHTINLIDTPGHSDFTFEVIRSLRILDGAICLLDGVAGVEAQTEKVWFQAGNYGIPRIIFVNKLDRDGAAFGKCVKDIAAKLQAWPAVCQIPWFKDGTGQFKGVVDIVGLRALEWLTTGDGKAIKYYTLQQLEDIEPKLAEETKTAREALIEVLSERDEQIVEDWEKCNGDSLSIPEDSIRRSLRKCLLDPLSNLVPVFAGASFRNIGVQPLLDNIVSLLPNPQEARLPEVKTKDFTGTLPQLLASGAQKLQRPRKGSALSTENLEACALAFKVVHDVRRGTLVYVRVYHGSLKPGSTLFNTNLQEVERVPRLLKMLASESKEVSSISAGQIGVITGLKKARTGDTLISFKSMSPKTGPPAPFNELQLRPIDVPPPVFFASVEPHSRTEEKAVKEALGILLREDPSLQLSVDEESGQTHLNGMGELHLEIARDRLIHELKAKANVGRIEIGYRERVTIPVSVDNVSYAKEIAGKLARASCNASVRALDENEMAEERTEDNWCVICRDDNVIETRLRNSDPEFGGSVSRLPSHLHHDDVHRALQNGVLSALGRGPEYYFRCHGVHVAIELDVAAHLFGKDTSIAALSGAARLATIRSLRLSADQSPTALIEPVMNVIFSTDEASMGVVMQDIMSSRSGRIHSIDGDDAAAGIAALHMRPELELIDTRKVYAPKDPFASSPAIGDGIQAGSRQRRIVAQVPLREMVGYVKHLRSMTAGRGTFVMSVDKFEKMNAARVRTVMKELRGI